MYFNDMRNFGTIIICNLINGTELATLGLEDILDEDN